MTIGRSIDQVSIGKIARFPIWKCRRVEARTDTWINVEVIDARWENVFRQQECATDSWNVQTEVMKGTADDSFENFVKILASKYYFAINAWVFLCLQFTLDCRLCKIICITALFYDGNKNFVI